jgi:hypothetical protein
MLTSERGAQVLPGGLPSGARTFLDGMNNRRDRPIIRDSRVLRSIAKVHADDTLTQGIMIVMPSPEALFRAHLQSRYHCAALDHSTTSRADSSRHDTHARRTIPG